MKAALCQCHNKGVNPDVIGSASPVHKVYDAAQNACGDDADKVYQAEFRVFDKAVAKTLILQYSL